MLAGCGSDSDTQSASESGAAETAAAGDSADAAADNGGSYFNKEGYPICDETITVAVAGTYDGGKDWKETTMIQEIENRFGIKLDCTVYEQEEWPTQLSLMMASDELPDLIIHASISQTDANSYGEEGYFLPINEYLEYMPNLTAVMEEYPQYKAVITAPDGNIYGLPRLEAGDGVEVGLANRQWIKQTWLDNLGLDYPETVEDFYNVLKAFKEEDAVDILINNAGVWLDHDTGTILDDRIDYDAILEQIQVNALGALRVTQALIGAVLNSFDQLVVNVSSEAASMTECSKDSQFGYCMSKAALNMASCIILNGIRKKGGAVINLHPGWMQSVIGEPAGPDAPYAEPAAPGEVKYYTTPEITARGFLKILDEPERFSGHMPGFVNYRGDRMNW